MPSGWAAGAGPEAGGRKPEAGGRKPEAGAGSRGPEAGRDRGHVSDCHVVLR